MIELSIIIPTYNRREQLRACLNALSKQIQPASDFEVLVVVDGSTDGTREMLQNFNTPFILRVLYQENQGQCAALNRGVEAARGSYCLILDDDILADPELVSQHLMIQEQHESVVGIGQIKTFIPPHSDWYARCFAKDWAEQYERLNRCEQPPTWMDCYGGNMSVPREAFLKAGGYATDLARGYDNELAYRLEQQGLSFVYIPGALGFQDERKGFRELAADAENAGAASIEIYQRHPALLPELLGSFNQGSWRKILLRRILFALHIPPRLLAVIGKLFTEHRFAHSWFGIIQHYCYWRGVKRAVPDRDTWRRLTQGVRVLMYHAIGESEEPPSPYIITEKRFDRQMAWLKRIGYSVICLEELLHYRQENKLPPAGAIAITFDDGYADNYSRAYPILRKYGFPATIFLVSSRIGEDNGWDSQSELAGRRLLSWSQIREMNRGGIHFGAHTRTHPQLIKLSPEQAREEVQGSRSEVEHELNTPVHVFAYPYGEYNSPLQSIAEEAGFQASCSIEPGFNTPATPLHALRRIDIFGTDSLLRFILALWLGDARGIFILKKANQIYTT